MKLTKQIESYFRKHVEFGPDTPCGFWRGPIFKGEPILPISRMAFIDAALIAFAVGMKESELRVESSFRFRCGHTACLNASHMIPYEPNRSGRRAVALEDRPGYAEQYQEIKRIVSIMFLAKAKDVLNDYRSQGGRIKSSTFSVIYHEVRQELGLPQDSVGRGRKKVGK